MSEGKGFARHVTLANLQKFAPLLGAKRASKASGGNGPDDSIEQSSDAANQGLTGDPDLAAAQALFSGQSIRTGLRFSRPEHGRSGKPGAPANEATGNPQAPSTSSEEVLLMRVKPRRDGKQLQLSFKIHDSAFMNGAREVVSAADGSLRRIDPSVASRSGAANTLRFEAPEMYGMSNPVVRFKWLDVNDPKSGTRKILQYEVFDADKSKRGKKILRHLENGIATPPTTNLSQLGREETVLSRSNRDKAQWYRLKSV